MLTNKSDLYEESVINKEEGENYAKSINALFFETSALDYESVSIAFEGLTKNYVENNEIEDNEIENNEIEENNNNNIPLIEGRNDRKKCCSCWKFKANKINEKIFFEMIMYLIYLFIYLKLKNCNLNII